MAGHSKWANIKHKKEKADAQKGKIFSRVAKEIISSVKIGGADPKNNPRLRLAIQKAKSVNFPNDNIEKNIKKASNPDQTNYDDFTYEIYGHGGVGLIVEIVTDNKNRIASEIRIATNKRGGNIASPGSVAFNFDRQGIIQVDKNKISEETLFQASLDAGAKDFEAAEEEFMITVDPVELYAVKEKLDAIGVESKEIDIAYIPKNMIICDQETKKANLALIEWLEDLEDVNAVYHNMDLSE